MSEPRDTPAIAAPTKVAPSGQTPDPNDLRIHERQEGWAVPLDRIEAFTSGAVIAVEPDRIEQELMALWRKAAERARDSGGRLAVARACLWNFIVHSDGEQEYRRTKRILDEVCETIPARVFSLHETCHDNHGGVVGDDGTPLRAFVEANYRKVSGGRREVVAEEITLESTHLQSQRLPGLVRGLLLADVPTALFVRNPAADYKWLPPLARDADRFLLDSGKIEGAAELLQAAKVLERLFPAEATHGTVHAGPLVDIADLGWLRLWPWRILVASLFDDPRAIAMLAALDELAIEYSPEAESGALLLAGWLVGRLHLELAPERAPTPAATPGAEPQGPVSRDFILRPRRPAARQVTLRLTRGAPVPTPVGIHRVTLRCGENVFAATGRSTSCTPCIELHSPLTPERVQPVQGRRDSELVVAAMGVGGRDPLMYEALRLGARLAQRFEGGAAAHAQSPGTT